jgi:hypothetical protein
MPVQTYLVRPTEVQAIQFTRYNLAELREARPDLEIRENDDGSVTLHDGLGGWRCFSGSYVIWAKPPEGEPPGLISVYGPQLFDATFTRGEQAP